MARALRRLGSGAESVARLPWRRAIVAVVAGALPMLAFPAPSWWWFAYVALVPWILLARSAPTGRRAAYDSWSAGWVSCWPCTAGCSAESECLHGRHSGTARRAVGALGLARPAVPRRGALGGAGRGRAPRPAVGVADRRTRPVLAGPRRAPWGLLGSSQWQVGPALRLASVGGVLHELPGGRRQCGARRTGRGA